MDALTLVKIALTVLLSATAGGGLVWFLMDRRRMTERIAELERRQADGPAWTSGLRLEHRAELLSVAALVKLAARDNLDALVRVSPGLADEVIREIAPHLFEKGRVE